MRKYETAGREADRELTDILGAEGRLYRADVLEQFEPSATRLSSSYEEWLAWWTIDAYIRPGFQIRENAVIIPCFLNVIANASSDLLLNELGFTPRTNSNLGELYFSSFHLLERVVPIANDRASTLSYEELSKDKIGFVDWIINENFKALDSLTPDKLKAYAGAVFDTLNFSESIGVTNRKELNTFVLQLIFGCERIIDGFVDRDYQKRVPKCIILQKQKKGISQMGMLRVLLMHFLAYDVSILVSGGMATIEEWLPFEYFDRHRYQEINSKKIIKTGTVSKIVMAAVALSTIIGSMIIFL